MKTVIAIVFFSLIGLTAQAQAGETVSITPSSEATVESVETKETVKIETVQSVARLYRYDNSRVRKALSFTTKRNKAKMA